MPGQSKHKNKYSFKEGNKAAELWTEEKTIEKLNEIYCYVKENKTVFIGTALVNNDLYKEIWAYFNEKFAENDAVFKLIKKIEQTVESNLADSALNGEKNPAMAIFILKNKHGYSDKQDIDINHKPEKPNISFDS